MEIRELPRGRFEQMAATSAPQGVVALAAPLREYAIEELLRADVASPARVAPELDEEWPDDDSDSGELLADLVAELTLGDDEGDPAEAAPAEPISDESDESDDLDESDESDEPVAPTPASTRASTAGDPAALASGVAHPAPLLLVVDGVTDPGNLGAILRTAECAGVTGVVLPRHRAARITATVTKRAAGAVEHLRFAPVSGIPTALATLAGLGVWSVGLDVTADHTIWDLDIADAPLALVLGAEGRGLSRLVRQRCDVTARIPVIGRLDTLNVSAATAVTLFEVLRRRTA